MKVCDKCFRRRVDTAINLDGEWIELCSVCTSRLKRWVKTPEGVLSRLFERGDL